MAIERAADARGLPLTTASESAARHFNAAVTAYLDYRLSAAEHLKAALAADPAFPLALCLKGYFTLLIGSSALRPQALKALAAAEAAAGRATPRERAHLAALAAWSEDRLATAGEIWERILLDHPTDLLALRLQHFNAFWMGHSAALRDVPAGVLPAWSRGLPGYGNVLGMLAFGLEECGDYRAAESHGRHAVQIDGEDLWARHAVAHVLEMEGRLGDGLDWLSQPPGAWADRNPFKDHLWWHTALFSLEMGDSERVLALYDAEIEPDERGFYLDIQNAVSLLWRLAFMGVDVGERWARLADLAETRLDDHALAFTDLHFLLALVAAERLQVAERLLDSLRALAEGQGHAAGLAPLTLAVGEAALAYGRGDDARCVERLRAHRFELWRLGASHAQRDLFEQLLIAAARRGGQGRLARSLLAARTLRRPNSRPSWRLYAATLESLGEATPAAAARRQADALAG